MIFAQVSRGHTVAPVHIMIAMTSPNPSFSRRQSNGAEHGPAAARRANGLDDVVFIAATCDPHRSVVAAMTC